jgi:hypothetical protein
VGRGDFHVSYAAAGGGLWRYKITYTRGARPLAHER